jgi:hypothetical protein
VKKRFFVGLIALLVAVPAIPTGATERGGRQPDFTVFESGGVQDDTLESVQRIAGLVGARFGVVHAGTIRLMGVSRDGRPVQVFREGYGVPVSTLVMNPVEVGPLLDSRLWAELAPEGAVIMSERSAALRGAMVGDEVELEGWNGRMLSFEISAVLPDEVLDWYELVLHPSVAEALDLERPSRLMVWDGVAGELTDMLLGAVASKPTVALRRPFDIRDTTDSTLSTIAQKERFGEFSFRRSANGDFIVIDPEWVDSNIVWVDFPETGAFRCHRAVVPYLRSAMDELRRLGLSEEISFSDFQAAGGCYVPRLMRGGDKGFAISRHAWGTAIDLNPSTNRYGEEGSLSEEFGQVLRRWGFAWGAGWTVPDVMHFEWTRIPADPERHTCAPVRIVRSANGPIEFLERPAVPC